MSNDKEPLFSAKNLKLITTPLGKHNPITIQVLGVCSALAVTAKLEPAIVLAISVVFVMLFANLTISLLRDTIPSRIRIIVQLVVIASLVILVDEILEAFAYDVSRQLSVFVGLIITNCIIMGRLEAFALANKPWPSILDGVGNAAGYGVILIIVGFVRELFGSGTLSLPGVGTFQVVPEQFYSMGYENNGFMILPPMALIVVGIIIWIQRSKDKSLIESN
ncbi:NADH:ubiquinone reductase (Na(+)-transporting) subunit D [Marinilabiliaceae bacterium ANBcel2]|nr:NADH:ubiquinone reductase (Na(+)-transporting) subunit D [Marinilabiliaceae bacterium ANBcel2]